MPMQCNSTPIAISPTNTTTTTTIRSSSSSKMRTDAATAANGDDNSLSNSITHASPTAQVSSNTPTHSTLLPAYQELYNSCQELAAHFEHDLSEKSQRLYAAFLAWQDFIVKADDLVQRIDSFAWKYDFDAQTPGNGYRSFVTVVNACIAHGQGICRNLSNGRVNMFFRKKHYMKEVEACSQLLSSLCTCLQYLLVLHDWSKDTDDLFGTGEHTAEELFEKGDTINQYCFYGRCLGFQYGITIRSVMRFISLGMAGFSEAYYAEADDGALVKTTRSIWTSSKYFLNPELRARRVVNISQCADIDFCKSFWFLAESELMHKIPSIVGSSIKVNRLIEIPAEPLQLPQTHKTHVNQNEIELIDIPIPQSHLGPGLPIVVRLLSYARREGMLGENSGSYRGWRKLPPRSTGIMFHCHGGGFVAQSSKSHELYLRDWAVALDVPILSVDYSLAPEAPFPRALEEAFYAYCWMLKNAEHLGTTAERVVLAGDSAGANLVVGVALKAIELGVRIPDGIFLAYCPTLVSFVPSPARLLCLMDPLLPFGFMMRCLRAYASPNPDILDKNKKRRDELANIREASVNEQNLSLASIASSRRTSFARSPLSSLADNSKWDQLTCITNNHDMNLSLDAKEATEDNSSSSSGSNDAFASASYHSQTVERTDLPTTEDDNSSCVSFEDDSQPIVHYPVEITTTPLDNKNAQNNNNNTNTEKYIDRFLEKYLIDSNTMEAKEEDADINNDSNNYNSLNVAQTASEENIFIETGKDMIALSTLHGRLNNAVNSISTKLSRCTQSCEIRNGDGEAPKRHYIPNLCNMDALIARSPSAEFAFQVPKDPFLSPYWAPEEWLSQMPSTKILTVDMDPCLDDCVMFARKLKSLGRPVALDILKGLPHGFLNFTMLSSEAMEGSRHCIKQLQDLFKMPTKILETTPTLNTSTTAT